MTRLEIREKTEILKPSQQKHFHPKIINCQVNQKKITIELEDKREISLPINLIVKEWFCLKEVKPEQLENYKIWGGGYTVFFPDLDEDIPVRVFTDGLDAPCCC